MKLILIDGGGERHKRLDDPNKPALALVPTELVEAAARALGYGAVKYSEVDNWRRGMAWSVAYSSLLRHLSDWWDSEDIDPESGLQHLDHAAASLAIILEYARYSSYHQFDDRPVAQLPNQGSTH